MVFGLSIRNPFFYRRSLLPRRLVEFACTTAVPPVKPSPVQNVSVINPLFTVDGNDNVYDFTVTWFPPVFSNGELQEYQIRVLDPQTPEDLDVLPMSVMVR